MDETGPAELKISNRMASVTSLTRSPTYKEPEVWLGKALLFPAAGAGVVAAELA